MPPIQIPASHRKTLLKITEGPLTGYDVELGESDRIDDYAAEAAAVFDLIDVKVLFVSDLTSLSDFLDETEADEFRATLDLHFGVPWSLAEPLIDILERARIAAGARAN